MPWWTTDIGGFHGGDIYDEKFRECIVRWFEYDTFSPVMRMHGNRSPRRQFEAADTSSTGSRSGVLFSGAENEVWSYGENIYEIFTKYMKLREKIRPYVLTLMRDAHEKGSPVIRPLFYDFPDSARAWDIDDEYMFGDKILVAPILYEGLRKRDVFLPEGKWRDINSGKIYTGNQTLSFEAPLHSIPVFAKDGCLPEVAF